MKPMMIFFSTLVLGCFSSAQALVLLPPVKAASSQELLYMYALQGALKHELEMSYSELTASNAPGQLENFRKMKLCDLNAFYEHQKQFFQVNKSYYDDISIFISDLTKRQNNIQQMINGDCKQLEKDFLHSR